MNHTASITITQPGEQRFRGELYYVIAAATAISAAAYWLRETPSVYMLLYIAFCMGGLFFDAYTPMCIRLSVLYTKRFLTVGNMFSLIIWAITIGPIVLNYIMKRRGQIEGGAVILLLASTVFFSCPARSAFKRVTPLL